MSMHRHGHRHCGSRGHHFGRGHGEEDTGAAWAFFMGPGRGGWGHRGGGGFGGDFAGWGDWNEGRGSGPRGGGRRGRMFAGGELRLVLLKLVAEQPRHGYELIKAVEELTGGQYAPSPGVVYPTLSLLADEGLIAESQGEEDGGRKAFAVTEAGEAELAEKQDEVEALLARLAQLGEREEQGRSPELLRAMANLAGVLRHRMRGGKLEREVLDEIVDLIDEAAKRIERL